METEIQIPDTQQGGWITQLVRSYRVDGTDVLVVHREPRYGHSWSVTHAPTGLSILCGFRTRAIAKQVAAYFADLKWGFRDPYQLNLGVRDAFLTVRAALPTALRVEIGAVI